MEIEVGRLCNTHGKGSCKYKIPVPKFLEKYESDDSVGNIKMYSSSVISFQYLIYQKPFRNIKSYHV
jgi:hypothetical protein